MNPRRRRYARLRRANNKWLQQLWEALPDDERGLVDHIRQALRIRYNEDAADLNVARHILSDPTIEWVPLEKLLSDLGL